MNDLIEGAAASFSAIILFLALVEIGKDRINTYFARLMASRRESEAYERGRRDAWIQALDDVKASQKRGAR